MQRYHQCCRKGMDSQQHLQAMGGKLRPSVLVKPLQSPASQPGKHFFLERFKQMRIWSSLEDIPSEEKPNQVLPGNCQ